ncbi:PPOX class F420-dependent oxidoreductase [Planosporangium mesophilum]|uniref:PPOX class F420-dependent enzyme n=1 Tax=Planosporangium mesophilum TaxID=689768 RepID=A0A8J3TFI0_9ACTN|nr:PPOX class F420-dependent oxidoreductase [Planosporangium mesophilum]NJC82422.1 PPOX class F420-dependent oxidoreductase [Planosporangium mesophilum]GII26200.1 PPOX class F420-dependent enzyme [Planosporangium mesophilum]
MAVALPELAKELLDRNTFVVLSTLNPDGGPQSSVIWAMRDGDEIVFSTILGRRKTKNMKRDPRISICAYDPADPYRYFEARGQVRMTQEGGQELINNLAQRYLNGPYQEYAPDSVRVVCRLAPTSVVTQPL